MAAVVATASSLLTKPAAAPLTLIRPSKRNPNANNHDGACNPSRHAVTCGPRDNRRQLVRGRTLSTEAILTVQALKRAAARGGPDGGADAAVDEVVSKTLVRLIKSDLVAALAELQRQDEWRLALKVFVAVRREFWYRTDYALYAGMVAALARNGMDGEIDALVSDLLEEQQKGIVVGEDIHALARLLKALIAAGRGEAVKEIYRGMKRGGCVGDEFLFRVLSKGLRRLGETEAADEVDRDYNEWFQNAGGRVGAPRV